MMIVQVNTRQAVVIGREMLTSGSRGIKVKFAFSENWTGYTKIAQFRAGRAEASVMLDDGLEPNCIIPWTVLDEPGTTVELGIFGRLDEENITPTVYCTLGQVLEGARNEVAVTTSPPQSLADSVLDKISNGGLGGGSGSGSGSGQGGSSQGGTQYATDQDIIDLFG